MDEENKKLKDKDRDEIAKKGDEFDQWVKHNYKGILLFLAIGLVLFRLEQHFSNIRKEVKQVSVYVVDSDLPTTETPQVRRYRVIAPKDDEIIYELNSSGSEGYQVVSSRRVSDQTGNYRYEFVMMR